MQYLKRSIDGLLAETLTAVGGVVIEGPRACGKTATALQRAASDIRLDSDPQLVQLAQVSPGLLLDGAAPRLIDEWQLAPSIWNAIRHEIDSRQTAGQFILSGSAAPQTDITRHTGAGRIARLRMRPMSLAESEVSSGMVKLSELQTGAEIAAKSQLSYVDMAEQAVRGGWPGLLGSSTKQALIFNRSYCDDLCDSDIPEAPGTKHDSFKLRRFLTSLARNVSTEVKQKTLGTDVSESTAFADPSTIARYMSALKQVFAVEEQPAWSVFLRSRARLRTSPKLHLADPALACAILGVGVDRLARSPEFFGQIFESMVVRDLQALAGAENGRVYHYRDNTGLEIDAIIEYDYLNKWAACEVKLGSKDIPEAETNLLKLRDERVDTERVGQPAFLAVITATEYAYTLPSGVHVVPLATLGM